MNQPLSIADLDIPGLRRQGDGVFTSGQPTLQQLERAQSVGLRTVISLCPHGECGWDEKRAVEKLGMRYVSVPVAGAGDVTHNTAQQLQAALGDCARPVLVHCASSNRVGALFALNAFYSEGLCADDAIACGKRAGLASLEAAVRQILPKP